MFTSHIFALLVSLLVEKPCMKLQKALMPAAADASAVSKPSTAAAAATSNGKAAKKERPRVFENPNAKYMNNH